MDKESDLIPSYFVVFENHSDTMKSQIDGLLGWVIYAVLFLSHSSISWIKVVKKKKKKRGSTVAQWHSQQDRFNSLSGFFFSFFSLCVLRFCFPSTSHTCKSSKADDSELPIGEWVTVCISSAMSWWRVLAVSLLFKLIDGPTVCCSCESEF